MTCSYFLPLKVWMLFPDNSKPTPFCIRELNPHILIANTVFWY